MLFALFAKFLQLQTVFVRLFILTREIVGDFTKRALHLDHVVL